jgi:hypothetical protein
MHIATARRPVKTVFPSRRLAMIDFLPASTTPYTLSRSPLTRRPFVHSTFCDNTDGNVASGSYACQVMPNASPGLLLPLSSHTDTSIQSRIRESDIPIEHPPTLQISDVSTISTQIHIESPCTPAQAATSRTTPQTSPKGDPYPQTRSIPIATAWIFPDHPLARC